MSTNLPLLAVAAAAAGACACARAPVWPAAPTVALAPIPAPAPSTISLPIEIRLDAVRAAAERALAPVRVSGYRHCEGKLGDGGWCATLDFTPSIAALEAEDHDIRARFDVRYGIAVRITKAGKPLVDCKDRAATITLTTRWDIAPDWSTTLETKTTVKPKNACDVKLVGFELDATGVILKFMRDALARATREIEAKVAASFALKDAMAKAWDELHAPLPVGSAGWIVVAPRAVRLGPVVAGDGAVTLHLGLTALPVFRFGELPFVPSTPLPALEPGAAGGAFEITLPVELPYAVLQAQLEALIADPARPLRYPPEGKRYLEVTGAKVEGFGGQVLITLTYVGSGHLRGIAHLRGAPSYDAARNVLAFPDADFSSDTNKALFDAYVWLNRKKLRDSLRERLAVDLSASLAGARTALDAALNGRRGGLEFSGKAEAPRLVGVWPSSRAGGGLVAYLHLAGTLRVTVHDL